MSINLPARGLAYTALMAPERSIILVLFGPSEPRRRLLDGLRSDIPEDEIAKVKLAHGDECLYLVNGTRIFFYSTRREIRLRPNIIAFTEHGRCDLYEGPSWRSAEVNRLLALGAEYAEL